MKSEITSPKKRSVINILYNIFMILFTILILGTVFNFYYSIGYILMIFTHELGHCIAAKVLDIKITFGNITPFGAYIVHEPTNTCSKDAIISIAGPIFGSICALIYFLIYYFTDSHTFLLLSYFSVFINLINLVPTPPLDGGFVAIAICPNICYIGLPVLVYFFIKAKRLKSKILSFITLLVGICECYSLTLKYKKQDYFKIEQHIKIKFLIVYIILLLILICSFLYFHRFGNIKSLFKEIERFKN